MNQEQKFDKIIRKKVNEAEFPFDENNWNKLSMQLDSERRVAAGWGKFLFLGLLFLGITSASIALYKTQGPLGLKDKLANKNSLNNNGSIEQSESENNLLASNDVNNLRVSEQRFAEKTNETNLTSGSIENKVYVSLNKNTPNLSLNNSANNGFNGTSGISIKEGYNAVLNKKELTNPSSSLKFSGVTNSIGDENKSDNSGLNEANSKGGNASEIKITSRSKSELNGEVILEHNILDRIDSKLQIVYSNRNLKLPALKLPIWYDDDYHRKGKKRLSYLNAEIGGAFLLGWDSKDGKDGRGLNWYAGVNYGKFYTKKIGFSVGSQFYNIGNINQSFFESSKSVYGLGSTSSNTVITAQSLYYFSVPVKFYYAVNLSNQIGVVVNPSFLFSSKNVVENYRLTDDVKSNEITTKSTGIYEGVRLNNVLLSVFYKTKLSKRMFLNTELFYGVRDIFKNTNSNVYNQKPLGIRLGIQYTLFEK